MSGFSERKITDFGSQQKVGKSLEYEAHRMF